ncbi:MAG TPA: hypothetical protein VKP30_09385 [Polyangiaceae bacterium]|nr:hypothetical protein [Polyangiaceae bacterium]
MTKYWMGTVSTMILAAMGFTACSDAPADIGEKNPALAKSDLAAYAATWVGYVEAYQFEDETDRVQLVLDEQGRGSIRFGDRKLITAPTDPAAYYPPHTSATYWGEGGKISNVVFSGFEYPIDSARVESERIRFGTASTEPFSSYCALQTPYLDALRGTEEQPFYKCLPYTLLKSINMPRTTCTIPATTTGNSWTQGDPTVDVNCEQLSMCDGIESFGCTCSAAGCSANTSIQDISLDAALDDDQQSLVGTLILQEKRLTVRLNRD